MTNCEIKTSTSHIRCRTTTISRRLTCQFYYHTDITHHRSCCFEWKHTVNYYYFSSSAWLFVSKQAYLPGRFVFLKIHSANLSFNYKYPEGTWVTDEEWALLGTHRVVLLYLLPNTAGESSLLTEGITDRFILFLSLIVQMWIFELRSPVSGSEPLNTTTPAHRTDTTSHIKEQRRLGTDHFTSTPLSRNNLFQATDISLSVSTFIVKLSDTTPFKNCEWTGLILF